jgi:hypothetical protein
MEESTIQYQLIRQEKNPHPLLRIMYRASKADKIIRNHNRESANIVDFFYSPYSYNCGNNPERSVALLREIDDCLSKFKDRGSEALKE